MGKRVISKRGRILLVFALVVLAAAFTVLFGEIILQEGNPLTVMKAVMQLELTSAEIVLITDDPVVLVQKKGAEEPLTAYLSDLGWSFSERLGAAVFYEKEGVSLFAAVRMLTRRYIVYELDREP